jgi:hypothetical protein
MMGGRLDPLDALLGVLLAVSLLVAGVLAVLDRPVPDLVEYIAVACIAGMGIGAGGRRKPERRDDHAPT